MVNIVDVIVEYDPKLRRAKVSIDPVVLDDTIGYVIWKFAGLPAKAEPRIVFERSRTGPFFHLTRSGDTIVGAGNRGPDPVRGNSWRYQVVLEGGPFKKKHGVAAPVLENLGLKAQDFPPLPGTTATPGGPPDTDPPKP
jgi:hypothetical protein